MQVKLVFYEPEVSMPYHSWGDENFDWVALNLAEGYINRVYHRINKVYPITKEKYGTIRYEMLDLWIKSERDFICFLKILIKATQKFPTVAAEIVDDAYDLIDGRYGPELAYSKGYFKALIDQYNANPNNTAIH